MTESKTVEAGSTEPENDDAPVLKIHQSGAISIPKSERGAEDGYVLERDENGRFVLTPIKFSHEPVEQSND